VGTARLGRWRLPLLAGLALVGGVLLAVVVTTAWPVYGDEHAYWTAAQRLVAGRPLYDPAAAPNTPYAYWYPPILAQVLAPLTLVLSDGWFTALWTILLVGCLWALAGGDVLVFLACIAFLPVALELRVRNIHLLIALLTVLALRRSWFFWIPAAAAKLAPGLGVVYLLAAGRRREAAWVALGGSIVLVASFLLSPGAWHDFLEIAASRGSADSGTFVAIPYGVRLGMGIVLALAAGRRGGRAGEIWLVVAITLANPTLWANAFSLLLAILPLLRSSPGEPPAGHPAISVQGAAAGS